MDPDHQETQSNKVNSAPIIAGCVVAGVIILVIAAVVIVLHKSRTKKSIRRFMSTIDMSTFTPQFHKNTIINEDELKNLQQVFEYLNTMCIDNRDLMNTDW